MQNFTCETSFHHFAQLCLRFVGNLHRLPLFSFCSLLILLFLCQSCQFFLEQFAGGFPSEHLPWVVVDPVLYSGYRPLSGHRSSLPSVSSFAPVGSGFRCCHAQRSSMGGSRHGHSLFGLIFRRLLHSLPVSELRAIVHGYGLEHLPESLSPFRF